MTVERVISFLLLSDLILLVIFMPLYFRSLRLLYGYLENSEPDIWKSLGAPTLFVNNSIKNSSNVIRYLVGRSYVGSNNDLNKLGENARLLLYISFSLGVVLMGVAFTIMIFFQDGS